MSNQNQFIALSNQLGIPGSSYRVQIGRVNGVWASRLAKGDEVLASNVFKDCTEDDPPNANAIVGWVLAVLPIPGINPYQIAKSVGFIRQESIRNYERSKQKPAVSIKEAKGAKLQEIPEEAKAKLASKKQVGWVKDETTAPAKSAASPAASTSTGSNAPKKKRRLPSIPGASPAGSSATSSKSSSDGTFMIKVPKGTKKIIIEFED